MSYARVIPRDLFNEANLLKCLGQLSIALENTPGHHASLSFDHDAPGWEIHQSPDDGSISADAVVFEVAQISIRLYRPLNSRQPFPLWVSPSESHGDYEDFLVFDQDGQLSAEFIVFIGARP